LPGDSSPNCVERDAKTLLTRSLSDIRIPTEFRHVPSHIFGEVGFTWSGKGILIGGGLRKKFILVNVIVKSISYNDVFNGSVFCIFGGGKFMGRAPMTTCLIELPASFGQGC